MVVMADAPGSWLAWAADGELAAGDVLAEADAAAEDAASFTAPGLLEWGPDFPARKATAPTAASTTTAATAISQPRREER
jgi:hypothetical protein